MPKPEKIKYQGHTYVRADTQIIRIAGKEYVLAQMTAEQAAKAALDISTDINALALFLKQEGLNKDYENMRQIAEKFSKTSDQLLEYKSK